MTGSFAGKPFVTLDAPQTVPVGTPIPITLLIENKTEEPLELYLRGREPTYDFVVTARNGDVVWRRLEREVVQAILRVEVLEPGQILYFRDNWNQRDNAGDPVPPGSYTIQGTVLTDGSSTLESPAIPLRIGRK